MTEERSEKDLQVKFEPVSLQNLCSTRIAITLLEAPEIQQEIKNVLEGVMNGDDWPKPKNFYKIVYKAMEKVDLLPLCNPVAMDVLKMVIKIGEKKYLWLRHVICKLGFESVFADKIIWTSDGNINEYEIFKKYWIRDLSDHPYRLFACGYEESVPLYFWACAYAQEDIIHSFEEEITKLVEENYKVKVKNYSDRTYTLMSLMLYLHYKREQCQMCEPDFDLKIDEDEPRFKKSDEFVIEPDIMLELSAYNGYLKAVEFYWDYIDEDEEDVIAFNTASLLIQIAHYALRLSFVSHKLLKLLEVIIFLIDKLSEEKRCNLISTYSDNLLEVICHTWPLQEGLLFEIDWEKIDYEKSISLICDVCHSFVKDAYGFLEYDMYRDFFEMLMEKIPKDLKIQIFVHSELGKKFCYTFCVAGLRLLFRDSDLGVFRREICDNNRQLIEVIFNLMENGDLENNDDDDDDDDDEE